jgi:hypothetical protein
MGDGQDTEYRPVSGADGLTAEQCFTLMQLRKPWVGVSDLGYGPEALQTVYGCEQEVPGDRESALEVRAMLDAAMREDGE